MTQTFTASTFGALPALPANTIGAQTFELDFSTGVMPPGLSTSFWYGSGASSREMGGDDLQIYSDAAYNGVNPFSLTGGVLSIAAAPLTPAQSALAVNGGRKFSGGLLTTLGTFDQEYGFWEVGARCDPVAGLWPGIWLLGVPGSSSAGWPNASQEVDIWEAQGALPTEAFQSFHALQHNAAGTIAGSGPENGNTCSVVNMGDWHDYGVLLTPTRMMFTVDRQVTYSAANPVAGNSMYALLDLAVGGWAPGNTAPAASTAGKMNISRLTAYALAPGVA